MKIPTFEEAKQALIEKRGTPLDKFVAYWEPEGKEDEKFREMLCGLLLYVISESAKREHRLGEQNYAFSRLFWNPATLKYEEYEKK